MTNSVRHFKLSGYCRYLFYIMRLFGADISKYQVHVSKSVHLESCIDYIELEQGNPCFPLFDVSSNDTTRDWHRLPSQPFDKNAWVFYARGIYEDKYFLTVFCIDYPDEFLEIEIQRCRKCGDFTINRRNYGLQRA